jgi:hypothetical protein
MNIFTKLFIIKLKDIIYIANAKLKDRASFF